MNAINQIDIQYLRSSRTLEVLLVSNGSKKRTFYLYNYEGFHFRLFETLSNFVGFLKNESMNCLEFNDDYEVEKYLEVFDLE